MADDMDLPVLTTIHDPQACLPPPPDLSGLATALGVAQVLPDIGMTRRRSIFLQRYPVTRFYVQDIPGGQLTCWSWGEIRDALAARDTGALDAAARAVMDVQHADLHVSGVLDALEPGDGEPLHMDVLLLPGAALITRELLEDTVESEVWGCATETLDQDVLDSVACLVLAGTPSGHTRLATAPVIADACALFHARYGADLRRMLDLPADAPVIAAPDP